MAAPTEDARKQQEKEAEKGSGDSTPSGWWSAFWAAIKAYPGYVQVCFGLGSFLLLGGVGLVGKIAGWQSIMAAAAGSLMLLYALVKTGGGRVSIALKMTTFGILVWLLLITVLFVLEADRKIPPIIDQSHALVDTMLLGLSISSWVGVFPVLFTSRFFGRLPLTLQQQLKAIDDRQKKFEESLAADISQALTHIEEREEKLVSEVEDATRSVLKGFPAIFDKAQELLAKAEREIWMVNFAVNFGSPHRYNAKIVKEYLKLKREKDKSFIPPSLLDESAPTGDQMAEFDADVNAFKRHLETKIATTPVVQILTVDDAASRDKFLVPLSRRAGYEELLQGDSLRTEWQRACKAKKDIHVKVEEYAIPGRQDQLMRVTADIPIQVLIVGLPRDGERESQFGCLVFMVGSGAIENLVSGDGFYTKLDSMVVMFKDLVRALMQSAGEYKSNLGRVA